VRKPKQEKHAYDARIALWPNRVTIEGRGGLNLYEIVDNDTVNWVDYLGLTKQNADGTWSIDVKKCEIYILYSHGSSITPHTFTFDDPKCSCGGFIGYDSIVTNSKVSASNQIPKSPMTKGTQDDIQNWVQIMAMVEKAKAQSLTFLCCKTVKLTIKHAPGNSWHGRAIEWAKGSTSWADQFKTNILGGQK